MHKDYEIIAAPRPNRPQPLRFAPIAAALTALFMLTAGLVLAASIVGDTPPPSALNATPVATISFDPATTEVIIASSTTSDTNGLPSSVMFYDPRSQYFCDSATPDNLSASCITTLTDPKLANFCEVSDYADSYIGGQPNSLGVAWALYECSQAQQALSEHRYNDCSDSLIGAVRAAMPDNTRKAPPLFGYLYTTCQDTARYNAPEFDRPVDYPK